VMQFIVQHAPLEFGFMSISTASNCQGYKIERFGPQGAIGRSDVELCGIHLVEDLVRANEGK